MRALGPGELLCLESAHLFNFEGGGHKACLAFQNMPPVCGVGLCEFGFTEVRDPLSREETRNQGLCVVWV